MGGAGGPRGVGWVWIPGRVEFITVPEQAQAPDASQILPVKGLCLLTWKGE